MIRNTTQELLPKIIQTFDRWFELSPFAQAIKIFDHAAVSIPRLMALWNVLNYLETFIQRRLQEKASMNQKFQNE